MPDIGIVCISWPFLFLLLTDIDELEQFVVEPNNQFVNVDLDFYEVRFPSALIAFTDRSWSEVLSTLQIKACADVEDKISDYRVSEDVGYQYVMIAFNDQLTNQCESLLFQVYYKGYYKYWQ